jgi:hypothetical protein
MRRNAHLADTATDPLVEVLRAVEDDAARHWLEAMLTRGEAAEVVVGDRQAGAQGGEVKAVRRRT